MRLLQSIHTVGRWLVAPLRWTRAVPVADPYREALAVAARQREAAVRSGLRSR